MDNARRALASIDAVLASVRVTYPSAATLVCTWDRRYSAVTVMGLQDDAGGFVDVSQQSLEALSSVIARPVPSDVLRLAYPESGLHMSGAVTLSLPVDEPVWARVLDHVSGKVDAGFRTSIDDVRTAVWLTLQAADLPSGSASLHRAAMFAQTPDEPLFEPVSLNTLESGGGVRIPWAAATTEFPDPVVGRRLVLLLDFLAAQQEREMSGTLLTDTLVTF